MWVAVSQAVEIENRNVKWRPDSLKSMDPFTNMDWLQPQHRYVITSIIKCKMKLLIHFHNLLCSRWSLGMDKKFHSRFYWASILPEHVIANVWPWSMAQVVRAFGMNPTVGGSSPTEVETFYVSKTSTLSQEHPFLSRKWMVLMKCWYRRWINSLRPRQMDAISQTTFSDALSWMKIYELRLIFHWALFLRVQLTIF